MVRDCGNPLEKILVHWQRQSTVSFNFQRLMGGALCLLEEQDVGDDFQEAVDFVASTLEYLKAMLEKQNALGPLDPSHPFERMNAQLRANDAAQLKRALAWFQEGETIPDLPELERLHHRLVNWRQLDNDADKRAFYEWAYAAGTRWSKQARW